MTFVPPKDRVLELSISNSQTVFAVAGSGVDTSYNAFSAHMSVGDTTIGAIVEPGVAFKSGVLTYSATNQLTIDSTGFESKGTFSSSGTKEVFMGLPAARGAALLDATGQVDQLRYGTAQALTSARRLQIAANIGFPFACGRLTWISATEIKFAPKNGDFIKINGSVYRIPAAGISIPATGVNINGTPGSNLASNTIYLLMIEVVSGNLSPVFTTNLTHAASATAGNEGIEIGGGPLDIYSVIGLVTTNGSAQFTNTNTLSWFNRRNKSVQGSADGSGPIAGLAFTTWADETCHLSYAGSIQCNTPSTNTTRHYVDGGTVGASITNTVVSGGYFAHHSDSTDFSLSEGVHTYGVYVNIGGGGTAAPFTTSAMVRG